MSYSISQLKRLACLLSAVMCASFSAEGAVKITECGSYQLCSTESKALNYALSKSNGDNIDIVLVNTVMNKTSIIEVRTQIGFGSPNKIGTAGVHGAPLGEEEIKATKETIYEILKNRSFTEMKLSINVKFL